MKDNLEKDPVHSMDNAGQAQNTPPPILKETAKQTI